LTINTRRRRAFKFGCKSKLSESKPLSVPPSRESRPDRARVPWRDDGGNRQIAVFGRQWRAEPHGIRAGEDNEVEGSSGSREHQSRRSPTGLISTAGTGWPSRLGFRRRHAAWLAARAE